MFWFFFKRFAEKNIKHDVNKRIIRNFASSTKLRTMKKIVMTLILVLPLTAAAQNSWEIQEKTQAEKRAELEKRERELKKEQEALKREEKALKLAAKESKIKEKKEKKVKEEKVREFVPKVDLKYLAGAVPVEDGKVCFHTVINAPGKSANDIYQALGTYLYHMTKESNQIRSQLSIADYQKYLLVGDFEEWLVFKDKALILDRTKFKYYLIIQCEDGKADVKLTRIVYTYDEERGGGKILAEEWITDEYGLNSRQDNLAKLSGKFRRKTIDRKDELFHALNDVVNGKPEVQE